MSYFEVNLYTYICTIYIYKYIISIFVYKVSDKIYYPLMIKTLSNEGMKENVFNLIKSICGKSVSNVILNTQRLFLPKTGNIAMMFSLITFIQHCIRGPSQFNNSRKINKRHTD